MPSPEKVTKESFRAELERLVANFAANEDEMTSPGYPEMQARTQFITPFFRALGWDVENRAARPRREMEVWEEKGPGEGGLDYFIARHYWQAIGRFIQPDEFVGGPVDAFSSNDPLPPGPLPYANITNPQSLNKYTYTFNNPTTYVDPDGHSVWTKLGKFLIKGGDFARWGKRAEKKQK